MTGDDLPAEGHQLPPSLLTAGALIAWRAKSLGPVPHSVILTHQESLFRALAPRLRSKRRPGLQPQLRFLPGTHDRLAAAGRLGVGGPAMAMAVEELAAIGVRRIVTVDVAASIDADRLAGDVVLVESAIAADGTARHYLPAGAEHAVCDAGLLGRIEAALRNGGILATSQRVWSTDAPFRETAGLIAFYRGQGAVAVDMETAAFYASAAALGVEAASVLVIADTLIDEWRPPADPDAVRVKLAQVADIVRQMLLA